MLEDPHLEADLVVGDGLGDGAIGIALFLAAVDQATGKSDMRASVLGAIQPILNDLSDRGDATAARMGLGGVDGATVEGGDVVGLEPGPVDPPVVRGAFGPFAGGCERGTCSNASTANSNAAPTSRPFSQRSLAPGACLRAARGSQRGMANRISRFLVQPGSGLTI